MNRNKHELIVSSKKLVEEMIESEEPLQKILKFKTLRDRYKEKMNRPLKRMEANYNRHMKAEAKIAGAILLCSLGIIAGFILLISVSQ